MTKHTPGPWEIRKNDPNKGDQTPTVIKSVAPNGVTRKLICQVLPKSIGDGIIPIEEAHANAKLISAAPELLQVLQQVLSMRQLIEYKFPVMPQHEGEAQAVQSLMSNVQAAIKKATS